MTAIISREEKLMDRRAFERIPANVHISFFYDDIIYTGTIRNLSGNCMYIRTDMRLYYYKLRFKIIIPLANGMCEVPVKITRLIQKEGFYEGMVIESMNPPHRFTEFIEGIKDEWHSSQRNHVLKDHV